MKRRHKNYSRPRKLYESQRIQDENVLVESYGLKNKREIWRTEAKVRYFRTRAKDLITSTQEEQQNLFRKLQEIGLAVNSIADVLALNKEDLLKRRLTSVLVARGLAKTHKEARQMVAHKRVTIGTSVMSSPSYSVPTALESSIKVKAAKIPVAIAVEAEA